MTEETITGQLRKMELTSKQLKALNPFIKRFRDSSENGCYDTYFHYNVVVVKQFSQGTAIIVRTEINDTGIGKVSYEDNIYIVLEGKLYISKDYKHRLADIEKMDIADGKIVFSPVSKKGKRFEEIIPLSESGPCRGCPNKN